MCSSDLFWRRDGTARGRTDMTTTPLTYRTAEEPDMSESTSPLAAPLVEATGLTKRYGSIAALDGFDVSLGPGQVDRKSTRLNSSHVSSSYAGFCLKKKNNKE